MIISVVAAALIAAPARAQSATVSVPDQSFTARRFLLDLTCPTATCTVTARAAAIVDGRRYAAGSGTGTVPSGPAAFGITRRAHRRIVGGLRAGRPVVIRLAVQVRDAAGHTTASRFRIPLTSGWAGTWATDRGPLTLRQSGQTVTGSYPTCDGAGTGTISATVTGRALDGTWAQPCNDLTGHLHFVLSLAGGSFSGLFGASSAAPSLRWDGTR